MEADDIYREVDARKKRASAVGIREIVFNLYMDSFKHYPAWINKLKDYVYTPLSRRQRS